MASDILIVDDEADIRELVAGILEDEGHRTRLAKDSDEALQGHRGAAAAARHPRHLAAGQPRSTGSRCSTSSRRRTPICRSSSSPATATSRPRSPPSSAAPTTTSRSRSRPTGCCSSRCARSKPRKLQARESRAARALQLLSFEMIGNSAAINQLRQAIDKVAPDQQPRADPRPVGLRQGACRARDARQVAARRRPVRRAQRRRHGARPRGGGAVRHRGGRGPGPRKVGALEEAHGGTLYIDEVADMPLETQGKVLRVLVEQKFQRLGGGPKVQVDVRIISSTSRDLQKEMSAGPLPRGPLSPPQRGAAARAGPRRAARGHPRARPLLRADHLGAPRACRRARSARTPSPCCRRTTGRATCASCATTSSG